jgi:hypothetical protein
MFICLPICVCLLVSSCITVSLSSSLTLHFLHTSLYCMCATSSLHWEVGMGEGGDLIVHAQFTCSYSKNIVLE